tara:strand:+ start:280 stop:525 length:246 start_codon:yes stop_codon:yes gene_type:complete
MPELQVIELRLDNVESAVDKHDRIIEQLTQSQIESKTGLTRVATELEITNGLIASYMANMQKIVLALITIVAGAMGMTQMG